MKNKSPTSSRLERDDWINAAIETLKKYGVDKVKVEPLASQLGVSRGSFYWHFKKRQDLLDGMLASWERVSTLNIIDVVEETKVSSQERLKQLLILAFSVEPQRYAFEKAIRSWSVSDTKVRQLVTKIDEQRIQYIQGLLEQMGWSAAEALSHAKHIYYCRTGLYHLAQTPPIEERLLTADYLLKSVSNK